MKKQKFIRLSDNLQIPAHDYAIQANAILGIRRSGKTYSATKIAEQLFEAGIPWIVFDPVGVWKNLKVGMGKHKGYPIVVAGGEGSDIILTEDNCVDVVRAAMKANISLVIDFHCRELGKKAIWARIVHRVVDMLLYENKKYGLRHIFLEEAAQFIPQKIQPQQNLVYSTLEELARMGRNFSLGLTVINQRSQEINKSVFELCEFCLLHRQMGSNSLNVIKKWFELRQVSKEDVASILQQLPKLKKGEAFAIGEEILPVFSKTTEKNTYHPSDNNNSTRRAKKPTINVSSFVTKLNTQLEKDKQVSEQKKSKSVKLKSPATEQKTITLQTAAGAAAQKKQNDYTKRLEVENEQLRKHVLLLTSALRESNKLLKKAQELSDTARKNMNGIYMMTIPEIPVLSKLSGKTPSPVIPARSHAILPQTGQKSPISSPMDISKDSASAKMIKAAAAYYPGAINRVRMALMTGLAISGYFNVTISNLTSSGAIEKTKDGYKLTDTYFNECKSELVTDMPAASQLIDMWLGIIGADSLSGRILFYLHNVASSAVPRNELAHQLNVQISGYFNVSISKLNKYKLIIKSSKGYQINPLIYEQ